MVIERDRVEHDLLLLHSDMDRDGIALDPKRDIEPAYEELSEKVNDINRAMF